MHVYDNNSMLLYMVEIHVCDLYVIHREVMYIGTSMSLICFIVYVIYTEVMYSVYRDLYATDAGVEKVAGAQVSPGPSVRECLASEDTLRAQRVEQVLHCHQRLSVH